ncbi:MAG: dihydroneopterin aldolase [Rhodospirillales bacterium]
MTEKIRYQSQVQIADGVRKIRHVFIHDMVIDCSIGIYTHEKEHEQRVRINLDLAVGEGDHLINDDIRNVISYEDMAKGVEAIIAAGHINLVETLAENIAEMCLQDKRVFSARVRVEKLEIIASAESVGVEIERLSTH